MKNHLVKLVFFILFISITICSKVNQAVMNSYMECLKMKHLFDNLDCNKILKEVNISLNQDQIKTIKKNNQEAKEKLLLIESSFEKLENSFINLKKILSQVKESISLNNSLLTSTNEDNQENTTIKTDNDLVHSSFLQSEITSDLDSTSDILGSMLSNKTDKNEKNDKDDFSATLESLSNSFKKNASINKENNEKLDKLDKTDKNEKTQLELEKMQENLNMNKLSTIEKMKKAILAKNNSKSNSNNKKDTDSKTKMDLIKKKLNEIKNKKKKDEKDKDDFLASLGVSFDNLKISEVSNSNKKNADEIKKEVKSSDKKSEVKAEEKKEKKEKVNINKINFSELEKELKELQNLKV